MNLLQIETGSQGALRGSGGRRHEVHSVGRLFGRHAMRILSVCFRRLRGRGQRAASQSDALLLVDPGIGRGLGEAGDGEI